MWKVFKGLMVVLLMIWSVNAFAAVGIEDDGVYVGEATTLDLTDCLGVSADGGELTVEVEDDAIDQDKLDETTLQYATVSLTNAEIKALNATPKELVAAPGAGKVIEFVSAVLILDYGSEVLTESADNLVIEYDDGGDAACSETIEAGSFIDASADAITNAIPIKDVVDAAADIVNENIALVNTGDGEYGGNASNDTTMTVKIVYRIHTTGL